MALRTDASPYLVLAKMHLQSALSTSAGCSLADDGTDEGDVAADAEEFPLLLLALFLQLVDVDAARGP